MIGRAALLAGTVTTGLSAGLLTGFAVAVMPGLARTDDITFISTMTAINDEIINPAFAAIFLGGLALPVVALAAGVGRGDRGVGELTVAGVVLYISTLGVTRVVHLPLNDKLGAGDRSQVTVMRRAFEGRWVRWHRVRTILAVGSFVCLSLALRLDGGGPGP